MSLVAVCEVDVVSFLHVVVCPSERCVGVGVYL
jgi:hypothetical protein